MKTFHIVAIIAFFSSTVGHAENKFSDCKEWQIADLKSGIVRAKKFTEFWQSKFKENLSIQNSVFHYLKAQKVVTCAEGKLDSLKFTCEYHKEENWDAETFPVLGKGVTINTASFFRNSENRIAGMIIHEATHKCGTTDKEYFNTPTDYPKDSGLISWAMIADTYEYWAQFGFCDPETECGR